METHPQSQEFKLITIENKNIKLLVTMLLETKIITELYLEGIVNVLPEDYDSQILNHTYIGDVCLIDLEIYLKLESSELKINSYISIDKTKKGSYKIRTSIRDDFVSFGFHIQKKSKARYALMDMLLNYLKDHPTYEFSVPIENGECLICINQKKILNLREQCKKKCYTKICEECYNECPVTKCLICREPYYLDSTILTRNLVDE